MRCSIQQGVSTDTLFENEEVEQGPLGQVHLKPRNSTASIKLPSHLKISGVYEITSICESPSKRN